MFSARRVTTTQKPNCFVLALRSREPKKRFMLTGEKRPAHRRRRSMPPSVQPRRFGQLFRSQTVVCVGFARRGLSRTADCVFSHVECANQLLLTKTGRLNLYILKQEQLNPAPLSMYIHRQDSNVVSRKELSHYPFIACVFFAGGVQARVRCNQ